MKRQKAKSIEERNRQILEQINQLKGEHPLWGYRRVWAYMKYRQGYQVNKKPIYRLMKENRLLVSQIKQLKAIRKKYPEKIRASAVNQVWAVDMTKVMITAYGWISVIIVLDWYTKKIVGWYCGETSTTRQWLSALNLAIVKQFPTGIRENGTLHLVSDNGSQPTSGKFINEASILGIKQVFASYNNPKGNADTERVIRTLKEDLVWTREWTSIYEFTEELTNWINRYNDAYPHPSLGYMTPVEFEQKEIKQSPLTRSPNSPLFCS